MIENGCLISLFVWYLKDLGERGEGYKMIILVCFVLCFGLVWMVMWVLGMFLCMVVLMWL